MRAIRFVSTLLLGFVLVLGAAAAQEKPDAKTVHDAYVYLLGRSFVIRQEQIDKKGEGFAYNSIKYNPLGSADFVNPNFDVAYLEAWIAVDDDNPALLEVPQIQGRYYTAQLLDEWGEVIANINERSFPTKPFGKFALVKPGSTAPIPADAGRIELHSSKAKLLARIELKDDEEGAIALQHAFKLTSLGTPKIAPPPELPMFDNNTLIGAEIFDNVDATLASALDVAPNAAEMQQKVRAVAAYVGSGSEARAAVDKQIREIVPAFKEYIYTSRDTTKSNWVGGGVTGNYGKDFQARSGVNFAGIWANTRDEAIYFGAMHDSNGQNLDGSNSYVMHFPASSLPQSVAEAYWSVILVSVPDYRVVPNPIQRYNFNNYSPLQKETDGSLKIAVGPKPVAGVPESNWLPSAEGKPFALTLRIYVPNDLVKRAEWAPPPVVKQ